MFANHPTREYTDDMPITPIATTATNPAEPPFEYAGFKCGDRVLLLGMGSKWFHWRTVGVVVGLCDACQPGVFEPNPRIVVLWDGHEHLGPLRIHPEWIEKITDG